MKGARVSDELVFLRRRLCEAEGRLDSLRSAGEELDASQAGRRDAREQLEKPRPHLRREAPEGQPLELFLQPRDVVRVAVPDASHGDAGDKVDVRVAVLVVETAAVAAGHRETRIEGEGLEPRRHVAALLREDLPRSGTDGSLLDLVRFIGCVGHSGTPIWTWPRNRAARYEAIRSEATSR